MELNAELITGAVVTGAFSLVVAYLTGKNKVREVEAGTVPAELQIILDAWKIELDRRDAREKALLADIVALNLRVTELENGTHVKRLEARIIELELEIAALRSGKL